METPSTQTEDADGKVACHISFDGQVGDLTEKDRAWIVRRGGRMAAKGNFVIGEISKLFEHCAGSQALAVRLDARKRICVVSLGDVTTTVTIPEAAQYGRMIDDSVGMYDNWFVRLAVDPFIPPFAGPLVAKSRMCLAKLEQIGAETPVVAASH